MSDAPEPVLVKAFALVEAILAAGRPLSLPELSEILDRPKQTVHRTARQLEEHGFLYREPKRDRYAVGPRLYDISKDVMGWYMRDAPRHAALRALVSEVGETCNVGILEGDHVLYLDRVESDFPLRAELQPGSRVPVHCTGLGKLLLAHLPTRTRKRLIERIDLKTFTDNTIADAKPLEDECTKIRKKGFAVNDQEYHEGIISLAVPIRTADDTVIAGLAVHAPAARLTVSGAEALVPALRRHADSLAADFSAFDD